MISLTWEQVRKWRLEQHCLVPRSGRGNFIRPTESVLGVQAQVTSAAELSIGARVDGLKRADVQKALWQDHTLVKTWAMRGTIHILAAEDLPLVVAARRAKGSRPWLTYFLQLGFTEAQYDEFIQAVPQVLEDAGGEPVTREALASGVAERMKTPGVRNALLGSSWGTLWKPSMFRGELCFGPSAEPRAAEGGEGRKNGRANTFVNPRKWLREWKEWEPEEALQELTRRYLLAYGPAAPRDFSFWWDGGGSAFAKKMFESLGGEVETVDVQGWKATALKSTLESMQEAKTEHSVRLLPMFDVYVLSQSRNVEPMLAKEHKSKVFRPAAWISAVVLVDGRIDGTWEYEPRNGKTRVKVSMFATPTEKVRREIVAEAERLEGFLDTSVAVEYADAFRHLYDYHFSGSPQEP